MRPRATRGGAAALALALMSEAVQAHAFKAGKAYPPFVEGVGAALTDPAILLAILPLGLLLGL